MVKRTETVFWTLMAPVTEGFKKPIQVLCLVTLLITKVECDRIAIFEGQDTQMIMILMIVASMYVLPIHIVRADHIVILGSEGEFRSS